MSRGRWLAFVSAAALVVVAVAAAATPSISRSINGTQGANGWYVSGVTLTWTVTGATSTSGSCKPGTSSVSVTSDTTGASFGCSASNSEGTASANPVTIRVDRTAPSVQATAARAPDANGWYSKPVAVSFSGSDATSGIESCSSSGATYGGPDNGSASVGASCKDKAGNTGSGAVAVKYDATPPQVIGVAPERPPDGGGFYNRSVLLVFRGQDAASGVQACAQVKFAGPEGEQTATGTCRDNAGNESAPFPYKVRYDSKPPALAKVTVELENSVATLRWKVSKDTALVKVTRSPGRGKARQTVVFNRKGSGFVDRGLRNGTKYSYVVAAYDIAGNVIRRKAAVGLAQAKAPLYLPAVGTRVTAPPVLRWQPVAGASYYNVQLYRSGVKQLSAWPLAPQLRLKRRWSFDGRRILLVPGVYTWYVWAGFGERSENRYGKLMGKSTFIVAR